jgi:hypothetical protein
MRTNSKLFSLSLVLTIAISTTSAIAAVRTPNAQPPDDRNLTPIERIIRAIKRRLPAILGDQITVPPPVQITLP